MTCIIIVFKVQKQSIFISLMLFLDQFMALMLNFLFQFHGPVRLAYQSLQRDDLSYYMVLAVSHGRRCHLQYY